MAFALANWGLSSVNVNSPTQFATDGSLLGTPATHTYSTVTDTVAEVSAANYFSPAAFYISEDDFIWCSASDNPVLLMFSNVDTTVNPPIVETVPAVEIGTVSLADHSVTQIKLAFGAVTTTEISNTANILGSQLADNPVFPGNQSITVTTGTTGQEPAALPGMIRYDTTTGRLRVVDNGVWTNAVTSATGITWAVVASGQTMAVNHGYFTNNAGALTMTLPATAAVGDIVRVAGMGAGGWIIAQAASQSIRFGSITTTVGAGGSLASTNAGDAIELVCRVANTGWEVLSSQGNITYV